MDGYTCGMFREKKKKRKEKSKLYCSFKAVNAS